MYCIVKDWRKLLNVASDNGDDVVKIWDLVSRGERVFVYAHDDIVKRLCYNVEE